MRKLSVILFSMCALLLSANAAATATTAAVAAAKTATPPPAKTTTPPKQVATAAKTAVAAPASNSLVKTDKNTAKAETKKSKPKKIVKVRKQVVDSKVVVWGRSAEAAEALAHEAARKLVGAKDSYLIKDTVFVYESASRVICMQRVNFTDEIPETWYLETEMVTGFGKSYERAYQDALEKAASKAEIVQNSKDWTANANTASMNASELGVVPYDYVFSAINSEKYCKLFFRYMAPR